MRKCKILLIAVLSFFVFQSSVFAQRTVSGTVRDAGDGSTLIGVTVLVKGTTNGTTTDINGQYSLTVPDNATLVYSFVGFVSQEILVGNQTTIDVNLEFSATAMKEVVVIGYGQVKKEDVTGSVEVIGTDEFNKGVLTSPEELLRGKTAGVQITSGGGEPGSGQTIRIRGGSSLSSSNNPLIVIDGVPVDDEGVAGMRNPLNTINPSDIESFTVLKDASATAIYGSRASNGVIIVTTKQGISGDQLKMSYNSSFSLSTRTNEIEVLGADEYRRFVNTKFSNADNLLGNATTDWQGQIFRNAYAQDHNLSFSGGIKGLPYRASIGYTDQSGLLKTSSLDRVTAAVSINPTIFDDHLKLSLNLKGMDINNRFADRGAIGSAIAFDPTQTVLDASSPYGGYYTWTQQNGDPIPIATANPLALLELTENVSDVQRSIGNLQLDYTFHWLPELRANLNVGYDYSESNGTVYVPEYASWSYDDLIGGGSNNTYSQTKRNEVLDFYLNYVKDLPALQSTIDVMGGYSWQHFYREGENRNSNIAGTDINFNDYKTESYLLSFFGRFNYTFKDRYLLTFTLRRDGSSRLNPKDRWGLFPAAAFAWKINKENFIKNLDFVSDLKLRLGYGITGQQATPGRDYAYLARYTYSEDNAQYQFGDTFYNTLRPEAYDELLRWETTTTYNIGLDYGFFNNRIKGAIDFYYRKTNDLINFISVPAGTNLANELFTNVGSLTNTGFEFSVIGRAISQKDLFWEIGLNVTYNKNEITKLLAVEDESYVGTPTGGISGGVGNNIQIHSVGYAANSFYVYEQVYDAEGNPIEGLYADRNGDGVITGDDRYQYKDPSADWYVGINSNLSYKNWDFSVAGRLSLGNYAYNNVNSTTGVTNQVYNSIGYLTNVTADALVTGFETPRYFSDYYVQNASFFRLDQVAIGYSFMDVFNKDINIRLSLTGQNLFVITNYEGLDPEIFGGIDNNIYPRPLTILMGIRVDF